MDAVDAARQDPSEVGLAHAQRQFANILAVADQHIEGVEHDLMVMLPGVQSVEIRDAVDAEQHSLAVETNELGMQGWNAELGMAIR